MQKFQTLNLNENSLVKNNRNIDKFYQNKQIPSYRVFLYFFDEIRGDIPLFKYPSMPINKNEEQILSNHSVWWHQDKFLPPFKFNSIDLELEGVIYCATLFLCQTYRPKKRSGMDSTKWKPERFVLIVKAPSIISFYVKEILFKLKTKIQDYIGDDLCFLVEDYLKNTKNSQNDEYVGKKSKTILKQLTSLCNSFNPFKNDFKLITPPKKETKPRNLPDSNPRRPKKLRFFIPKPKNN